MRRPSIRSRALAPDGATAAADALALDRFPVAGPDGRLTFERAIDVPADVVDTLRNSDVAVVVHGADLDDSGTYDGDAMSSLDAAVPLEGTLPVACGIVPVI